MSKESVCPLKPPLFLYRKGLHSYHFSLSDIIIQPSSSYTFVQLSAYINSLLNLTVRVRPTLGYIAIIEPL